MPRATFPPGFCRLFFLNQRIDASLRVLQLIGAHNGNRPQGAAARRENRHSRTILCRHAPSGGSLFCAGFRRIYRNDAADGEECARPRVRHARRDARSGCVSRRRRSNLRRRKAEARRAVCKIDVQPARLFERTAAHSQNDPGGLLSRQTVDARLRRGVEKFRVDAEFRRIDHQGACAPNLCLRSDTLTRAILAGAV